MKALRAFLLLTFTASIALFACSSTPDDDGPDGGDGGAHDSAPDVIADASPCPAGQALFYPTPGCGIDAKPVCEPTLRDACLGPAACGCDGKTIYGACGSQSAPYSRLGACEDGGG